MLDTRRQWYGESRLQETAAGVRDAHEDNRRLVAMVRLGIALQGTYQIRTIHDLTVNALTECGLGSIVMIRDNGHVVARLSFPQVNPLDEADTIFNSLDEIRLSPDDPDLDDLMQAGVSSCLVDPLPMIGRVLAAHDGLGSIELDRRIRETEAKEAVVVPIAGIGAPVGLILLWGKELQRKDTQVAALFAEQVSAAMEQAYYMQTLQAEQEQLRSLAMRLIEAEEYERRHIMRDLHDQVAQNMSALGINLSLVKAQMSKASVERVGPRIDGIMSQVERITEDVRRVMTALRPPVLDDYGLTTALRWYGAQFSIQSGIAVQVREIEPLPRLAAAIEIALFRIVQEALANVASHGRASQVHITIELDEGLTRLILTDDSGGYGLISTVDSEQDPGATLLSLTERTEAIGGRCRIKVGSGRNIQLVVEVKG